MCLACKHHICSSTKQDLHAAASMTLLCCYGCDPVNPRSLQSHGQARSWGPLTLHWHNITISRLLVKVLVLMRWEKMQLLVATSLLCFREMPCTLGYVVFVGVGRGPRFGFFCFLGQVRQINEAIRSGRKSEDWFSVADGDDSVS
jgi:hypothetical protein